MNERRKALMQKVQQQKRSNAGIPPTDPTELATQTSVTFSKHFMIEPQGSDDGGDVFAVYRVTDLVNQTDNGTTPEPVHVFDLIGDAAQAVVMLDQLVDKLEGDDAVFYVQPVSAESVETGTETTQ